MRSPRTTRRQLVRNGLAWLAAGLTLPAVLKQSLAAVFAAPTSGLDVRTLGARGDGVTDDTAAIQSAIDQVYARGGGTVLFPPGTYLVRSVNVFPGITYLGDRAVLKRPDDPQGEFRGNLRTFNTRLKPYSGAVDSPPLVIRNLTFDGNVDRQGAKGNTEQSHLLFLEASARQPGRLKVLIDGCTFQNSPSDAITVYVNVDVEITNTVATNCRRGGLVFNGGNTKARVTNFKSLRGNHRSRIDMEIAAKGYSGGTQGVDLVMNNVYCDGNVELEIAGGTVEATNVQFVGPLLAVFGRGRGTARFSHSVIRLGPFGGNRLQSPGDVTFTNCRLEAWKYAGREAAGRERTAERPDTTLRAIHVRWDERTNQTVRLVNCDFVVDRTTVPASDEVIAVFTQADPVNSGNRLIVEGGSISEDFDTGFQMERGGDWMIRGTTIRALKTLRLNGPPGFPYHVVLQDVIVRSGRLTRTLAGEGTRFEYP